MHARMLGVALQCLSRSCISCSDRREWYQMFIRYGFLLSRVFAHCRMGSMSFSDTCPSTRFSSIPCDFSSFLICGFVTLTSICRSHSLYCRLDLSCYVDSSAAIENGRVRWQHFQGSSYVANDVFQRKLFLTESEMMYSFLCGEQYFIAGTFVVG